MQVFSATLNQMLVLFIFMALGFFLNKKKLLPLDDSVVLSKLETYAFVPCLVFNIFINTVRLRISVKNGSICSTARRLCLYPYS